MTSRRNKMLSKLMKANPSEGEQQLLKLAIERICADMSEYFRGFYSIDGPGVIVYVPEAEEKDSMFYLPVAALMTAVNDLNNREMNESADVLQKAIARAESVNPEKEALFIIQDSKQMSLVHYKYDNQEHGLLQT